MAKKNAREMLMEQERPPQNPATDFQSRAAKLAAKVVAGTAMNQTELAVAAGLSRDTIYRQLNAKNSMYLETAVRLCRAAGVSLSVFDSLMDSVGDAPGELKQTHPVKPLTAEQEKRVVELVAEAFGLAPKEGG